jgi:hypothetical protein
VRNNPDILSPLTEWELIFHHFLIGWYSAFFGLFWAFSGIPNKSRKTLSSMYWFWFSWNVYRLRKTRNRETRHIRGVHPGVCAPCAPCAHPAASAPEAVLRYRCLIFIITFVYFLIKFVSFRFSFFFCFRLSVQLASDVVSVWHKTFEERRQTILCESPMVPFQTLDCLVQNQEILTGF